MHTAMRTLRAYKPSNRHSIPVCHICRCQRPGPELKTWDIRGHGDLNLLPWFVGWNPTTYFSRLFLKSLSFHVLDRWNINHLQCDFEIDLFLGVFKNKTNQEEFLQIRWNWWKVSVVSDFGAVRLCPETIQQLDIFWSFVQQADLVVVIVEMFQSGGNQWVEEFMKDMETWSWLIT